MTINSQELTNLKLPRVPYGKAVYGREEIDAVIKALHSGTQMGQHVYEMERQVAQLFDKPYGVMVNSGSSANYLAIEILDLPEGSEVVTPALTFSTTLAPIIKNGLTPVFVDVEEGTYNIDASQIESRITEKTKALFIPNLIGNVPDWKELRSIADKYNLFVIEDSADTIGATYQQKSTGTYSDISTTSFYGSHVISCAGNGGMICLKNENLMKKAKLLRSWGRSSSLYHDSEAIENRFSALLDGIPYDNKFVFEKLGYNLEPSEIGAAFGLVQLQKLDKNIKLRERWFASHLKFFQNYDEWFVLPKQDKFVRTGWLAFPLTIKSTAPFSRKELQIFLEKLNIQTRTIFTGNILRQPCLSDSKQLQEKYKHSLPNTNSVMEGGVLLACHNGLTEPLVDHLYKSLTKFCCRYEKIDAKR